MAALVNIISMAGAAVLALVSCVIAFRFMKKSHEEEAKAWEGVGFNIFMVGFDLFIGEAVLLVRILFESHEIIAEGMILIGTIFWVAASYFGARMAFELAARLEEMMF